MTLAPVADPATEASAPAGLDQRLEVVCRTLGLDPPLGPDSAAEFIVRLRDTLPRESAAYVLFQTFLARLPSQREIDTVARRLEYDTTEQVRQSFLDEPEFANGGQADVRFEPLPESAFLVDVSHTLTFPHNTGIQRVVRCLCRQMADEGLEHRLIGFDPKLNNYRLLDANAAELLFHWERPRELSRCSLNEKISPYKGLLRYLVGKRLSESVRSFARGWRDAGRGRRKCSNLKTLKEVKGGTSTVPFLWNQRLLMPEVNADVNRLDRVNPVLTHTPVSASMVVYDLIPLLNPECVDSADGFLHYLTLLRTVDRISCISRAVERDVRDVMRLIDRDRPPPEIETHYLGGDFDFARDEPPPAAEGDLPVVLVVGSIETRKNQCRILRAMTAAQERGCKFRGVFAGNLGKAASDFTDELAYFQARGFQVEFRRGVGEEELRSLYARSQFTLFCSLAEGFGLPIVESVVKGVPCIVSDRGCMREIAEKVGGCVLVDPESESDIAEAIVALCNDPQRLQSLRAEANAAEWHTWRDYAHNVYQFAVGAAPAGSHARHAA